MKAQNKTLYPIQKIENGKAKIAALAEGNKLYQDLAGVVGNISQDELKDIFDTARAYAESDGGISALEAQKLGIKVFKAAQSKQAE